MSGRAPFAVERGASLYLGDCRQLLSSLPADSVDSVVTDPPYELAFMGKAWDSSGVAFDPETWRQVLRVLKPGGHLLAFGGTRTYHRMACAIEDAGFEIRDQLQYLYGTGFPKSLDVSKAMDKAAGAERTRYSRPAFGGSFSDDDGTTYGTAPSGDPITDAAREWDGWGTALKPANEPICMARKPLIGTVAANVLEHGTGALNIDACRIGETGARNNGRKADSAIYGKMGPTERADYGKGRFPSNVLMDTEAARLLDEQTGVSVSRPGKPRASAAPGDGWGMIATGAEYSDSGGASRFFYTAKASRSERTSGGQVDNTHATVKPLDLTSYLIRLVTRPGGVVLDPFTGSGTTAVACLNGGWRFIGCELLENHAEIAAARMRATTPNLFDALEAA